MNDAPAATTVVPGALQTITGLAGRNPQRKIALMHTLAKPGEAPLDTRIPRIMTTFTQPVAPIAERAEGLAGATVLRGVEGFGRHSRIHTTRLLRLSEDLPIVIEIVDTEENVARVLPALDEMIGDGLVTLERVQVITYRSREE